MEKKLYCVRVVLYVMAENASGACVAATKAPFDIFECHARKAEHLDPGWENAVPYNADDDRTCAEVLASEHALHPVASFSTSRRHQEAPLRPLVRSAVARPSAP